ncbi:universal stress protein [Pseudodesulfovibrio sp. zrk46]|uniref:universal stress protein n=1 Tax=Pseudodesulfovibrio sp. zrk46 TaxID=2725288 RepID=UPI001FFCDB75|nr:universal stress protein [Pseudodesulfovibrio sp. zrk46]
MPLFTTLRALMDKHYKAQAEANCNTCHVGSWVICREDHLMQKNGGSSMIDMFKRFTQNRKKMITDTPVSAEAYCDCERQECKILIVCKGNSFSRAISDYAIHMAKKTRSSLVALNLDESGRDFNGFSDKAKNNIDYFSCKAAESGISFCHEIRQGDEETIVAQMHEADPRFKYVMDDTAVVCKSRNTIPVYTRATLRAK